MGKNEIARYDLADQIFFRDNSLPQIFKSP